MTASGIMGLFSREANFEHWKGIKLNIRSHNIVLLLPTMSCHTKGPGPHIYVLKRKKEIKNGCCHLTLTFNSINTEFLRVIHSLILSIKASATRAARIARATVLDPHLWSIEATEEELLCTWLADGWTLIARSYIQVMKSFVIFRDVI